MFFTKKYRCIPLLLFLCAIFCCSLPVFAVNPAQAGAIVMQCTVKPANTEIPLVGDTYVLIPVQDNSWTQLPASKQHAKALQLAAEVSDTLDAYPCETTDQNGTLKFSPISSGSYLIVRKSTAQQNKKYQVDPFLVSVQQSAITVTPKFSWDVPSTTTPNQPKPDKKPEKTPSTVFSKLPYTGQLQWPITVLAAVGLVMIFVGQVLKKQKK